ncbi:glycosyltransferase family 39 protein [Coleofasciculus sp. FACHB-129]|uniref:glycosyltransferase family 39 protein n=1 Tax=Cyanophyceae TaxID=3028117 RepID=UPI0016898E89|nr:glycosyltransferase family 39 protein [Coleofasciculus sp. FACHB-129]MBD1896765.1 glycosyltransferase family 39 protein [Coleofasciculus sp. FACHB-129]
MPKTGTQAKTNTKLNSRGSHSWELPPTWLQFLVISVLVLGIFFRFANLDRKVYQHDEAFTSMRISGYSKPEVQQQLFDGRVISVEDLQRYQRPNSEKDLIDTMQVLAQYPEHPPLYYVMARFWVQCFGSSVAVTRSLGALISLLAFPGIYWLCRELFESSLTGWIAIAIIAISPLHVLYAQEARQYSLWTAIVLLSSAALLRAIRVKTKLSWAIYAVTAALGLYSNLFFGLTLIGHGIYVILTKAHRENKTVIAYLVASIAAFLTFVPWVWVVLSSDRIIDRVASAPKPPNLFTLVKWWTRNLSNIFLDVDPSGYWFDPIGYDDPFSIPLSLILVGYSIYFLYRHTPAKVWLFIFTFTGMAVIPLMLRDLMTGGFLSTAPRYLIPSYLGIQIAIAYLLASKITWSFNSIRQQKLWQFVIVVLLSCGVLSCAISFPAEVWWNKFMDTYNPQVARIVNQASHPLVISDTKIPGSVLSLSRLLSPKVQLQLVSQPKNFLAADGFSEVFLFDSSDTLRNQLEKTQGYNLKIAFKGYKFELWEAKK